MDYWFEPEPYWGFWARDNMNIWELKQSDNDIKTDIHFLTLTHTIKIVFSLNEVSKEQWPTYVLSRTCYSQKTTLFSHFWWENYLMVTLFLPQTYLWHSCAAVSCISYYISIIEHWHDAQDWKRDCHVHIWGENRERNLTSTFLKI